MAEIFPFRGLTFNGERVGGHGRVVTQPYDKITPAMREEYFRRSPFSIARIICSAPEGADLAGHFHGVARTFRDWLKQGLLTRSRRPCLYPYHQTYKVPGSGRASTRRSFIGLGRLHDYREGVVRPHEKTHSGPKLDRLELTRHSGCQFGQLFMLYPDPEQAVNSALEAAVGGAEPLIEVTDEDGVIHRVWAVEDQSAVAGVQELMGPKNLYIADGHHRYETALTYWREQAEAGVPVVGNEAIDRAMMSFVSIHDQGLSVLPTHRVMFNLDGFSLPGLIKKLSADFDSADLGPATGDSLARQLEQMASLRHNLIAAAKGAPSLTSLRLKASADPVTRILGPGSAVWKGLEVNVLHRLVLEEALGVTAGDLEHQTKVAYLRDPREALRLVLDPGTRYQAAFFLNPTGVEQVAAVADNGEFMPQKSTDFYPKMLTGLVINQLNLA